MKTRIDEYGLVSIGFHLIDRRARRLISPYLGLQGSVECTLVSDETMLVDAKVKARRTVYRSCDALAEQLRALFRGQVPRGDADKEYFVTVPLLYPAIWIAIHNDESTYRDDFGRAYSEACE